MNGEDLNLLHGVVKRQQEQLENLFGRVEQIEEILHSVSGRINLYVEYRHRLRQPFTVEGVVDLLNDLGEMIGNELPVRVDESNDVAEG